MSNSTLIIIGAAVVLLLLVLFILARTGRKPHEGPAEPDENGIAMVQPSVELSPVATDEPMPEPGMSGTMGLATAEIAPEPEIFVPAGPPDELTRLKGLGPKAAGVLNALGITRYDQVAALSDADVARIDSQMGPLQGRITRDRWVEQARFLAADDRAGFEAVFGKLG